MNKLRYFIGFLPNFIKTFCDQKMLRYFIASFMIFFPVSQNEKSQVSQRKNVTLFLRGNIIKIHDDCRRKFYIFLSIFSIIISLKFVMIRINVIE